MATGSSLLAALLLIVVPFYIIYKPPKLIISYFQNRYPEVLFQVETSAKIVALTIDDAPSEHTSGILEVLQANNVKATFFAIGGQVAGRESILRSIIDAGCEVGNHAMHDEPSISVPSDILATEIEDVDAMISHAYHAALTARPDVRYFRPGSGIFSRRILDVARKAGYHTVLGSIYPHDPFIKFWRVNAWHIMSMIRPGAIIICHDRRSWTVPMLKRVLPELKRRGYEVVTVSKLLEVAKA